ncbi:baseplate J/gp47 family protein [Mariprofundus ferrooxydans]|uniref:Tail protein, putative n=1 Tax=Mariprofundus ferrooxydans PV-1 TaxID=314345 RepID=Q0F1S6_9PROT|nr:baseplate J/gp47 family protein [Mariprofundus ferrooxydans]EAU55824.1 tail protein, putative [Mariprofundus ferrooxydans PV-1]KON47030.1 phage tail protein [Mariprofundus ferrooxydans]
MPYPFKTYRQIRDDILRDIRNLKPDAAVGKDSDHYVRASASGASIEGLYEHQQWIVRQIFASTADEDYLELMHANPRGIERKVANRATGNITFSGTPGETVPINTEVKTVTGIAFITGASDVIGAGGTVDIAATASAAGLAGNQDTATALTLSSPPPGIQSQAAIVSMSGGTDVESKEDLLARVLFDMRLPPAGGADFDYYRWALDVPGVTDAYVYPKRRAINSVDVVIETAGGLPSAQLIADVQAYLDYIRPVTADVLAMAPTLITVDITAQLVLDNTTTLAAATASIQAALTAWFDTLHVGELVAEKRLTSLMMDISGVIDVTMTAPTANIQPLLDATHSELAVLGTVALT